MAVFWVLVGVALLGTIIYLLQLISLRYYLSSPQAPAQVETTFNPAFPPVSLLKPLKGLDDHLFENLESFCNQDYPDYEIIFSLQDPQDPAYKVVQAIKEKYPQRDITLLAQESSPGLNPKVNNLIPAYAVSRHPFILISDSNVRVGPDYLKSIMRPMEDPQVGLVNNLIKGVGAKTLGAALENMHMNSFIMGSICFLELFLKMTLVVGKSMLMRKEALEAIGGFAGVKDFLAEDYIMGRRIEDSGRKVIISNYMINNVNENWGVKRFMSRHARWAKMRWRIVGPRYLSELVVNPVFISLFPLIFWGPSAVTLTLVLGICGIKILGDFYHGQKIGADLPPWYYLLVPVKDLLIAGVWFVPLFSNTVTWRGNKYKITKDSLLQPIKTSA